MFVYEMKTIRNDLKTIELKFQPVLFKQATAALILLEREQKISAKSILRKTPTSMKRKSGKLPNSFTHQGPVVKGNIITGKAGSNVVYARIHEEGGTITAGKRATKLAIPFKGAPNKGPAWVMKYTDDTFVKNDIIFLRMKNKKIKPLFSLRRSVKIPATRYLTKATQKATPRILELLGEGTTAELRSV